MCHKYDIRHDVDTPVANHFNLHGHSLEENVQIIQTEQPSILGSKTENELFRLEREAFSIRRPTLEKKLQKETPFAIKLESGKYVER